jgi:Carboxypeptidase regulatory-like domain
LFLLIKPAPTTQAEARPREREGGMKCTRLALIVPAVLAGPQRLLAQVDTGTIAGTVRDPSGAAVAGAQITVTEVRTNATTTVTADSSGAYVATLPKIGTYDVTAEVQGFKKETRRGLVLRVQDRLRIDFDLAVGG